MPGPPSPTLKVWNAGAGGGVNPVQVVNGEAVLIQSDTNPPNGEDQANDFGEQGATATTFARFDFRLPSADNGTLASDPDVADEGVFFVSLRAQSPASSLRARTGVLAPAAAGDFRLGIHADSSNLSLGAIWPTDLEFDTTYRAVISYNATNAMSQLWLDPVDESSARVTHTGTLTGSDIDRIVLRQATDYAGKQILDNLVVATTFAEALSGFMSDGNGDYNGDGFVDAADYVVWRKNDGSQEAYDEWAANFGSSVGSGSGVPGAIHGVPEPSTVILFVLSVTVLSRRRRVARTESNVSI
ncbi:MAG: PEP-CTERM sorting domain-containing protein [Pirellulales bacterium]